MKKGTGQIPENFRETGTPGAERDNWWGGRKATNIRLGAICPPLGGAPQSQSNIHPKHTPRKGTDWLRKPVGGDRLPIKKGWGGACGTARDDSSPTTRRKKEPLKNFYAFEEKEGKKKNLGGGKKRKGG